MMMKYLILLVLMITTLFGNIGTVMASKGKAIIQRTNGKKVYATAGLKVLKGDVIVTQKNSRVQVMLKDETVVTIGAKSKFSFDEYLFDGAKSKVKMSASRGFFRSVTGRIGKLAPQRFKVKTASATIGIRGTDFWGITGGETERVTCNKGAIVVEYNGQSIEVGAGSYATYGPKGVKKGKTNSSSKSTEKKAQKKKKEQKKKTKSQTKTTATSNDKGGGKGVESSNAGVVPATTSEPADQGLDAGNVAIDDIANITQVIDTPVVEKTTIQEPFTMTLGTEDRPKSYE